MPPGTEERLYATRAGLATLTPRQTGDPMRRLNRSEWVERLQGLSMGAVVEVHHPALTATSGWRLSSAEFAPFEDVIEVVLTGDGGLVRVLIDQPLEIWADDADGGVGSLEIRSKDASVVVARPSGSVR